MKTTKLLIVLCLAATALVGGAAGADGHPQNTPVQTPAQASTSLVSVSANGTDVRQVLHDLFSQAKMNYVIEQNVKFDIYLSLDKVEFDEALGIVCHLAKLKADKQNGIYYVSNDAKPAKSLPHAPTPEAKEPHSAPTVVVPPTPTGPVVSWKALKTKLVTTRLPKTSIKNVMAELSDQTGIPITVDPLVPNYKLDAYLNHTSLKYALDHIMAATHLHYTIVDRATVRIFIEDDSHVAVNP